MQTETAAALAPPPSNASTNNNGNSATSAAKPRGGTLSVRTGASRKLLERKAAEKVAGPDPFGPGLEDSFPGVGDANVGEEQAGDTADTAPNEDAAQPAPAADPADAIRLDNASVKPPAAPDVEPVLAALCRCPLVPEAAPPEPATADPAPLPASAPAWSEADEAALNAMLAQRKAAGFQRRGRDVSGQLLRVGAVQPNAGTVVATIVGLVADRGTMARADLLDAMAGATFAHPKARPADRGLVPGYVAGAVKDGYLALADLPTATADAGPAANHSDVSR